MNTFMIQREQEKVYFFKDAVGFSGKNHNLALGLHPPMQAGPSLQPCGILFKNKLFLASTNIHLPDFALDAEKVL